MKLRTADIHKAGRSKEAERSLTKDKNDIGPRIELYGTPEASSAAIKTEKIRGKAMFEVRGNAERSKFRKKDLVIYSVKRFRKIECKKLDI